MIKRAPSRNQRSKGIRVKHVLQICLLLGVCFWLIYQVKHSHDKRKEFDDKDAKVSLKARNDDKILKLGRKDLPQVQEAANNERHEDEEEDAVEEEESKPQEKEKKVREREEEERDAVEGQEEANKHAEEEHEDGDNKHEDDEQEEENKNEEEPEEADSKLEEVEQEEESKNEDTEDERREGVNDELDEQDQERTEGEVDREDEFGDEEKEREREDTDRESKGNEGEEQNGQVENENLLDDHDHEGVDGNAHIAREEHYKADDASSAVSHGNRITISETEKATSENSNENYERNVLEDENKSNASDQIGGNQKNLELKLGEDAMAESGGTSNATTTEEKSNVARSYNSQEHLPLTANNTSAEEGKGISNNSTGLSTELTGASMQNGTETNMYTDAALSLNVTLDGANNIEAPDVQTTGLEQADISNTVSNGNQFDFNTTIYAKTVDADAGTRDSFNNSVPALSETFMKFNATADEGANTGSSGTNEIADTTQNDMSNRDGTNESSDSSTSERTVDANSDSESGETNKNSESFSKNEIVEAVKEDPIDSSDSSILQDSDRSRHVAAE